MMTNRIWLTAAALCALSVAACAAKDASSDAAGSRAPVVSGTVAENTVTVTATVEAVDLQKRLVTLKGPGGDLVTVHADERVKNLPQVKKGDLVVVTYYESLAYEVHKPGQGAPGVAVAADVASAKKGEKPAAVGAQAVTVTSTIEALDKQKHTVTLKGPEGNVTTIKVKDPSKLELVKVGDLVEITYTEALAIGVEPAAKKK
jgi:hypothetical protein